MVDQAPDSSDLSEVQQAAREAWSNVPVDTLRLKLAFPEAWEFRLRWETQQLFVQGLEGGGADRLEAAIRQATLQLEERLRLLCDAPPDVVGTALADLAFHPDSGVLTNLRHAKAEREGLMFLFRGAIQRIRNPAGHRRQELNPVQAFGAISVVDYLIKAANDAAVEKFVHPFLSRNVPNLISLVRKLDIDGDGLDETVLLLSRMNAGEAESAVLVLKGDPPRPIAGSVPTIRGVGRSLEGFDLDDDGLSEAVAITSDQTSYYMLVVSARNGALVSTTSGCAVSVHHPFELLRPPESGGTPRIVGYDEAGAERWWDYVPGEIRSVEGRA